MESKNEMTDVKISEDLYLKYRKSDRGTWANQAEEDRAFKSGAMWKTADQKVIEGRGQIAPITNEILPTIDLVVAQLTENSPRFYAVGREKSDAKTAGAYADTMAYIWDVSNGDEKNEQVTTDFEDIGLGFWMAYIDPYADSGKGEIKICDIDPMEVYVDPNSKDPNMRDASNILIVKHFTEEVLKTSYPNVDLSEVATMEDTDYPSHDRDLGTDQVLRVDNDTEEKVYRVIDRYTKVKSKRYHVYDKFSGFEKVMTEEQYLAWANEPAVIVTKMNQETYLTSQWDVNESLNIMQNYGNIYHLMIDPMSGQPTMMAGAEHGELAIPNSTTQLMVVPKGQLIEEGKIQLNLPLVDRIQRVFSIGDKEITNYEMEIEEYPIVGVMLHHFRNPFPQGDIRLVKSLQEQLNKIDNLIITYNQNITNVKMFVQKGSGVKKELEEKGNKAGFQVFEMDMDTDKVPFIVQLTQMSNSFYQQRENLIRQIQRIIGAYSFQDGDVAQAPQTKGGTILMDEMMQRRTARKRRKLERALNHLGTVVAQMIPTVYTEEKMIRIIRPNHKPKEVVLNKRQEGEITAILNDMSIGKYDLKVISGSMLPTNKMQRREEKLRLYELGLLKDPEWFLRDLDENDVDEIIERESALRRAEQMIAELQGEIKRLSGQLQTKSREVIQANEKVAVKDFEGKLKQASNKIESNVLLTQQRLGDMVKEEKKNSGKKDDE